MTLSLATAVKSDQLLAHLKALEGERHPYTSRERLEELQHDIAAQLTSWGLSVSSEAFSYMGEPFVNLLARPPGHPTGPRLIVGAHLDTVPGTPGADDNASGVAALLETARVIASGSWRLPIEFVVFNLEELGMVGSTAYAQRLRRTQGEVLGMLSLEMVGFTESQGLQHYPWFLKSRYPATGNYLGLAANRRSRPLLKIVEQAMRSIDGLPIETMTLPGKGWGFPEARLSDHSPFWDAGFSALLVTDTSFFRNPHYHQASDTVETLDLAFLEKVTQGLVATVETLANSECGMRNVE